MAGKIPDDIANDPRIKELFDSGAVDRLREKLISMDREEVRRLSGAAGGAALRTDEELLKKLRELLRGG